MADLAPHVVALLVLAALCAGFIDSIAGGGGLIAVPALLAAGINPVAALATNKVQGSFGTASATYAYWRAGLIDFRPLKAPLIVTLVGAAIGAWLLTLVDPHWLMVLLPFLLVAIAVYFLTAPKMAEIDSHARLAPLAYAFVAGAIGLYDGFFGPGTGSFFALSLISLMGMGLTRATAHAKALNLMSNIVSVAVFATSGHVLWLLGLAMAIGQFVGGRLGAKAAMRFGGALIRPLLVVISLGMTAKLLADPANPLRQLAAGWLHR
jgi:uncharacterized membrane protein YfcA